MPSESHDARPSTVWADRAARLYDDRYARRYRHRDVELEQLPSHQELLSWLGRVCDLFDQPIDVLDLGCGTGRYFWGLRQTRSIVGLDASSAMLEEARQPVHGDRLGDVAVTLIEGDLLTHDFAPAAFDLVYSIGVLAEHVPLDAALVKRVAGWLKPRGRFAFTTVHPSSPSVPRPMKRRAAAAALALLPAPLTPVLHRRFVSGGLYADERWIAQVVAPSLEIESLARFHSDVHLHTRCVARKRA